MNSAKPKPLLTAIAIFILGTVFSYGQSFLSNGLVAYYPFNGNASDGSGNGYDGIISSNCWFIADRFGNTNHAIFTTNDQADAEAVLGIIDIPAAALNTSGPGTISAWIKPSTISSGLITIKQHDWVNTYAAFTIGGFYDSSNAQYVEGNPGTLYFVPQNFTTVASSTSSITTQTWQQVVVTFTDNSCSFYIDGILCGTNAGNFSVPDDSNPDVTSIGCWFSGAFSVPQQRLVGAIDDVRIYNRALSDTEVQQLHQIESSQSAGNPQVGIGKAVFITFTNLTVGYDYQIQTSTDLNNWTNYNTPFTAITSSMTYSNYWHVNDWNQLFFRLH